VSKRACQLDAPGKRRQGFGLCTRFVRQTYRQTDRQTDRQAPFGSVYYQLTGRLNIEEVRQIRHVPQGACWNHRANPCVDSNAMPKKRNMVKNNKRAAMHQYEKTVAAYAKCDAQEVADMREAEIGWTLANRCFDVQQPLSPDFIFQNDDIDVVSEHHHDHAAFARGLSLEDFLAFLESQRHGTKRPASDGHEWRPVPPRGEQPSQRLARPVPIVEGSLQSTT
jgi:hypothetical protein